MDLALATFRTVFALADDCQYRADLQLNSPTLYWQENQITISRLIK